MAQVLESMDEVVCYAKNHNLGFFIPYAINGQQKNYIPDFIVCIDDGHGPDDLVSLIVEVTGEKKKDKKGGDEQARETAATAGFELARSVSGAAVAAAVRTNVVSLARVPIPSTVPILPGNQQFQPSSPVVAAPPPPPPPPHECYGYSWRSGYSGGASGVATRAEWRSPTRTR